MRLSNCVSSFLHFLLSCAHGRIIQHRLAGSITWALLKRFDSHKHQKIWLGSRKHGKKAKEFESISNEKWHAKQKANFLKTNHLILSTSICIHIPKEHKAVIPFWYIFFYFACRQIMNTLDIAVMRRGKNTAHHKQALFITFESWIQIGVVKKFTIYTWFGKCLCVKLLLAEHNSQPRAANNAFSALWQSNRVNAVNSVNSPNIAHKRGWKNAKHVRINVI